MQFVRLSQIPSYITCPTVAMIGTFDGFHLGHQILLQNLKYWSKNLNLPSVVILFEPQPSEYFLKSEAPARIMSLREKLVFLKSQDINYVCCLPFNKKLSALAATEFVTRFIKDLFHCQKIIVGQDFRFGAGRQGDVTLLTQLGWLLGFAVEKIPDEYLQNERISSTKIRIALAAGDIDLARVYLGSYYSVSGRVIRGDGLARQFGVPTANIYLNGRNLALRGIFQVKVNYNNNYYNGVASIGFRPSTHNTGKLTLEVHLFDWNCDLYGRQLEVIFLKKIRDEQTFDNAELLVAQIHKDVAIARLMAEEI